MSSKPTLIVSSSPYLHCGLTISTAMRDVIIALIPTLLAALYFFGLPALTVITTCVVTAVATEALCQKVMNRPITITDGSAVLTGLLLAFCLPPSLSIGLSAFGSFCAVFIGKQVFGGLGSNIFNPAHVGRAILLASFPLQMTTWTTPSTAKALTTSATPAAADAVTTATPLAVLRNLEVLWGEGNSAAAAKLATGFPDISHLFLGNVSGSLGETSVLAILLGGIYLLYKGHIDWRIPVFYLATLTLITGIYGWFRDYPTLFPIYHLLSGGVMIGAFFMATDWVTSPITRNGRIVFAIGLGVLTALIRLRGGYVEGVCYSILIMNMITPLIDRYLVNIPFGGGARNEQSSI